MLPSRFKDGLGSSRGAESPRELPPSMTPDQVSLQDCPVTIPTAVFWGPVLSAEPVPPPVVPVVLDSVVHPQSSPAPDPVEVPPSHQPVCNQYLGPEQMQQMITTAIQQSLAAGLHPTGRVSSVRSFVSVSLERDYSFSAGDPGSLTSSIDSHPSNFTARDP